jgi:hypothetical protein
MSKEMGHRKSLNPRGIGTVHMEGTHGRNRSYREKARQEVIDRRLGHRDIGDPVDKVSAHFGNAKAKTPMSGSQLSA